MLGSMGFGRGAEGTRVWYVWEEGDWGVMDEVVESGVAVGVVVEGR